jgi:hypothetical protein
MLGKGGKTEAATEIDHVISLQDNWSLRLSLDNLQSLDKSWHSKKTTQEQVERKKEIQQNRIDDTMDILNNYSIIVIGIYLGQ